MYIGLDKDYNSLILYQYGRHNNKEKTMKKKMMTNKMSNEAETETKTVSMFSLMKMIDSNTSKIERFSMKIDKLNNLNAELKSQLKSMIEKI